MGKYWWLNTGWLISEKRYSLGGRGLYPTGKLSLFVSCGNIILKSRAFTWRSLESVSTWPRQSTWSEYVLCTYMLTRRNRNQKFKKKLSWAGICWTWLRRSTCYVLVCWRKQIEIENAKKLRSTGPDSDNLSTDFALLSPLHVTVRVPALLYCVWKKA